MAVTVNSIQTLVNQYLHGDTSTNSVSAADRLAAITESVKQVYNDFGFNQTNKTYVVNYFDTVNIYDITTALPDFLEPVDIRLAAGDNYQAFTRKTPREITVDIDLYFPDRSLTENAFAVEQANGNRTLIINHISKYSANSVSDANSLSDNNGTWALDTVNSDASNLRLDTVNFQQPGTAALEFDVTAAQSVNNRATIYNPSLAPIDMSNEFQVGALVFWVYLPDVVNFTSITVYWGSDSSATPSTKANYYSASATTGLSSAPWAIGWQRVEVDWNGAATVGTPNVKSIRFIQFDFNYGSGQVSKTGYHLQMIKVIRPEPMTLHYQSWYVGTNTGGTAITNFSATTDIPFFSGQYDFFDVYCAHLAASILFREMGLLQDANNEEGLASRESMRLKKKFPSQMLKQTKYFGVKGVNFRRRKRGSSGIYIN